MIFCFFFFLLQLNVILSLAIVECFMLPFGIVEYSAFVKDHLL